MKQNARTFIYGSFSSLREQQLVFLFGTLFSKARKVKFGFSISPAYVVLTYVSVAVRVSPNSACHFGSSCML
jgi:hypothetical protein